MRVAVAGLGSMGKRRIRLMRELYGDGAVIAGVDSSVARREESRALFGIDVYDSLDAAVSDFSPDAGFVCAPPLTHAGITRDMLSRGMHVFSEINLTDVGYDENRALAEKKELVLFLSSTPMYRKDIQYIGSETRGKPRLHYRYHVGQYLPDWHPWESYTDFFVGDKRTNGCREIFAIELPWLIWAFGDAKLLFSRAEKLTELKIDYPDCYSVELSHENGVTGQISVDLVSRKAVRDLGIFGENMYIAWKGTPESLIFYDTVEKKEISVECYSDVARDSRYAANIVENAYSAEITDFFSLVGQGDFRQTGRHGFEADKKVLSLIDEIEGAGE